MKAYSVNKTHALLHTQNIPRVLYSSIQHSGILSYWENLVTLLLRHQMKNEW